MKCPTLPKWDLLLKLLNGTKIIDRLNNIPVEMGTWVFVTCTILMGVYMLLYRNEI